MRARREGEGEEEEEEREKEREREREREREKKERERGESEKRKGQGAEGRGRESGEGREGDREWSVRKEKVDFFWGGEGGGHRREAQGGQHLSPPSHAHIPRKSRGSPRDLRVTSPAQFCGHVNLEAEEKTCPHSFLG